MHCAGRASPDNDVTVHKVHSTGGRWKSPCKKIGKKVKGEFFAPVENPEQKFWRKFGGIAPIPPASVEGQRSRVKVKC